MAKFKFTNNSASLGIVKVADKEYSVKPRIPLVLQCAFEEIGFKTQNVFYEEIKVQQPTRAKKTVEKTEENK